jgi:hypothetical protein
VGASDAQPAELEHQKARRAQYELVLITMGGKEGRCCAAHSNLGTDTLRNSISRLRELRMHLEWHHVLGEEFSMKYNHKKKEK